MTYRAVVPIAAPTCLALALVLAASACGESSPQPATPARRVDASNQIIGPRADGTAKELIAKGEKALLAQRWQDAVDAFEAVVAGDPASANDPQVIYDLAVAYEGVGARDKARARYRDVSRRFASSPNARASLVREVSLDGYLEDWPALGDVAEVILARASLPGGLDPADKMLALGARALSKVQAGDDTSAMHDVNAGLDLADENHYGMTGQLPVAVAMLKFTLGEVKRARSEKVVLNPPPPDFVLKLETRCALLLEAQSAYADAIRAIDPQWAAMSGFKVGDMYRTLHRDLMLIPPNDKLAKTEHDKQLFYGIMHVRYRVLLEKGVEMMDRTLALGEKLAGGGAAAGGDNGTTSAWMKRAEASRAEMQKALEDERAMIKTFPFTEEELEKALDIMKKEAEKSAGAAKKT